MARQIRQSGFAWIEVLIVIFLLAGLFAFLFPTFSRERMLNNMTACADNLHAIGKAISLYAEEYGTLPVAGGHETKWEGKLHNWYAARRQKAFGLDPNESGGQATVSSSLYLLVRYANLAPKTFVCPSDKRAREFRPQQYRLTGSDPRDLWDFGPTPQRHCSYAYQMVYGLQWAYRLASLKPGHAIAADRSPWMAPPSRKAVDFSEFMPDLGTYGGTSQQAKNGNTLAHKRQGENVLFADTHVDWEKRPYCSLEDDNIYTSWDSGDKSRGVPPKLGSVPADKLDSLLVNDPVLPSK